MTPLSNTMVLLKGVMTQGNFSVYVLTVVR
jgi:hypothetical protein